MTQTSRAGAVPKIAIELDRTRHLVFSYGTVKRIEEETGRQVEEFEEGIPAADLAKVVWAMLAHEDRDLTVEDVEEMLFPGNLDYVAEKISEVVRVSRPDDNSPLAQKMAKEKSKAPRHRSKSSGASQSSTSGSKTPSSGS